MGCDGGTIPTRDELVRLKKKPEKKDKNSDLAHKWNNCSLSQQPLRQPIVACELGRLYTKENVLEMLLDRTTFECSESFSHIRTLKDVKVLELTENTEFKEQEKKGDSYQDIHASPYICPITGLGMNGRFRFVYLHGCGCVMAERAMKEAKCDVCLKCGASYSKDDVIIINGDDEDQVKMERGMETRRQVAKFLKKGKKSKKPAEAAAASSDDLDVSASKKPKLTNGTEPSTSKSSAATGHSSKLPAVTGHSSKLSAKTGHSSKLPKSQSQYDKKPVSVQQDPKASKTFKSLFTSHPDAKNRPTGPWVTFNPQYFH